MLRSCMSINNYAIIRKENMKSYLLFTPHKIWFPDEKEFQNSGTSVRLRTTSIENVSAALERLMKGQVHLAVTYFLLIKSYPTSGWRRICFQIFQGIQDPEVFLVYRR